MKTLFDDELRNAMLARIARVTSDSRPTWGKMKPEEMLAHLVLSMRLAVGELQAKPENMPIRYPPLRQLVVYFLPVPKGIETSPELKPSEIPSLQTSGDELTRLIGEFGRRASEKRWPEHPAFGKLGRRAWGVLTWKHLDHHLRQFGV